MDVSSFVKGLVRGSVDAFRHAMVGPQGDVKVSKFLPDYAQLVAEGRVWRAQETTATASVVALPTTAGLFTIGNNEPDDGLWYVGLVAYAYNAANAAAIDNYSLVGCLSQLPALTGGIDVTMAQDLAKTTIKSMGGVRGGGYNGKAILDTGVTVTDDRWFPVGPGSGSTGVASGTGGAAVFSHLYGLVVLPPKTLFSLVSTATSTSNTTTKGFIWAEVPRGYLLPS